MGLKKKLENFAMGKITGIILAKIAAGDFGALPARLYAIVAGYKTRIAACLALPPLIIEALVRSGACEAFRLPCDMWSSHITAALLSISGALAYLGQVDGALRMPPPEAPKG